MRGANVALIYKISVCLTILMADRLNDHQYQNYGTKDIGVKLRSFKYNIPMIGNVDSSTKKVDFTLQQKYMKHIKLEEAKDLFAIFEFKQVLGQGNFGVVVEAIEKASSDHVAIKIINKYATGTTHLNEIQREIKILKCVSHPHIVNLDRIYETAKKIYLVFELCIDNLYNKYKTQYPFPDKINKRLIKQLTEAVSYLHKHDIVHRDIKMENILLSANPEDETDTFYIKLADFGLSVIKSGTGITGMLRDKAGTVMYMAPEILLEHTYSELCDIWSIGIILYALIYGKHPFTAQSQKELAGKICNFEPNFSTNMVSNECIDLMKSTLIKDPVKRITAGEMLRHPWLTEKSRNSKNFSVVDYMREWKDEMKLPGEESDWVSDSKKSTSSLKVKESKKVKRPATTLRVTP